MLTGVNKFMSLTLSYHNSKAKPQLISRHYEKVHVFLSYVCVIPCFL